MSTEPNTAAPEAGELDAVTRAVLALAEANIPVDIQSLLIQGSPMRDIVPGALAKALRAAAPQPAAAPVEAVKASIDTMREAAWDLIRKNDWQANDRLSLHSAAGLMAEFGMIVNRGEVGCGYPECGCCADAACEDAIKQHFEAKQPVARVWSVSEAVAPPGMQVACVKVTAGQSLKVGDRLYSAPLPPLYAAPPLAQDVINLVVAAREFWDANNDLSAESKALDKALEPFAGRVPYENEPDEASAALASDRKEGKAND